MNENNVKIVEFFTWCPSCKYFEKNEEDDPCYDCISIPARENSTKPEFYVEKEN